MIMKSLKEKGIRSTVWIPEKLNKKVEKVRKVLGLSKSGFYRYAIIEVLKQFQVKQIKSKEATK
jgi:hypothetical protein